MRNSFQEHTMTTEVLVLGGGYAGVAAANKIAAGSTPAHVTLVNRWPRFVERIRLHQLSAGSLEDVSHDFASVLHPAVNLVVGEVSGIDAEGQTATLAERRAMRFDYLIYTAGSGVATVPGGGYSVANPESAARLRTKLASLAADSSVAVVGGGLTGVETATEIAQQHPSLKVTLSTAGVVTPGLSDGGRGRIRRGLHELGVQLLEHSADGPSSADVVVWCTGFRVPSLAADSGLPVDEHGRLLVDANLLVPGTERVFGAGDAVAIQGAAFDYVRMSCAAALPMGMHVGANVLRAIRGQQLKRVNPLYVGQCISLGRGNAVVQAVTTHDTPLPFSFSGRAAGWLKEGICRGTVLGVGLDSGLGRRSAAASPSALTEGEGAAA
jgi:NADH dehydrogenase FAD-containing subunit